MNLPEFLVDHPDGEIRLTGHRISLYHVVYFYNEGYSPEMLVCQFPTLSLVLVHKVIAFYLENQAEVDRHVAEETAARERQRANTPPSPGVERFRQQLEAERRAETQITYIP
jgi:uncharacterized protein (DUF433 family)